MAGVQAGFADGIAKTPFLARSDPARRDYCGECPKTCNVKCIGLANAARALPRGARFAEVGETLCLGCGACIGACANDAIALVPRPNHATPPRNRGRPFARMLWEKGRLWAFLTDRAKLGWRSLIGGRGKGRAY